MLNNLATTVQIFEIGGVY